MLPTLEQDRYTYPGVIILLFTLSKIPFLFEPFYWDEAWVYVPAVIQMAENGISLLPDAIDLNYSRGHPLFFHYIGGLFASIFGKSVVSLHAFAVIISAACIAFTFLLAKEVFNKQIALCAALFVGINELFFVQSVFVLPEILLATLTLSSFYYYTKKNGVALFISLSLLALTKETALLFMTILAFKQIYDRVINRKTSAFKINLAIAGSYLVFASTFLLNKYYHGWYFYPGHTEYFDWEISYLLPRVKRILGDLVSYEWHWMFFIPIVISFILYQLKNSKRPLIGLTGISALFAFSMFRYFPLSESCMLWLFSFTVITGTMLLFKKQKVQTKEFDFTFITVSFTFAFILFSAVNFYTNRYILSMIPFFLILSSASIFYLRKYHPLIPIITIAALVGFQINKLISNHATGTAYSKCYQVMDCHKSVADFLSENVQEDANVKVDFLMFHHYSNPDIGYAENDDVNYTMWGGYEYIVYENILPDYEKHFKILEAKNKFIPIFECDALPDYRSVVYQKVEE